MNYVRPAIRVLHSTTRGENEPTSSRLMPGLKSARFIISRSKSDRGSARNRFELDLTQIRLEVTCITLKSSWIEFWIDGSKKYY